MPIVVFMCAAPEKAGCFEAMDVAQRLSCPPLNKPNKCVTLCAAKASSIIPIDCWTLSVRFTSHTPASPDHKPVAVAIRLLGEPQPALALRAGLGSPHARPVPIRATWAQSLRDSIRQTAPPQ